MSTWTGADQAELDALLWRLVSDYFEHRQNCRACARPVNPADCRARTSRPGS